MTEIDRLTEASLLKLGNNVAVIIIRNEFFKLGFHANANSRSQKTLH